MNLSNNIHQLGIKVGFVSFIMLLTLTGCSSKDSQKKAQEKLNADVESSTPEKIVQAVREKKRQDIAKKPAPQVRDKSSTKLKEGLLLARKLWETRRTNGSNFKEALKSIIDEIPEVKITGETEKAQWNRVELNQMRTKFDAVKFKSPLSVNADMHWMFTTTEKTPTWYIIPVAAQPIGFRSFDVDRNIEVDGIQLPPACNIISQTLSSGTIRPGEEYILWFASKDDQPATLNTAIKLSPQGTFPPASSMESVAKVLGEKIQPQTYQYKWKNRGELFSSMIRMIGLSRENHIAFDSSLLHSKEILAELPSSGPGKTLTWTHLEPTHSFKFNAVKFKSPLNVPGELTWSIVSADELPIIRFISDSSGIAHDWDYSLSVNSRVSGVELPGENISMYGRSENLRIEPGEEVILWCVPQRGALPDLDIAVRFIPTTERPVGNTVTEISKVLGIEVDSPTPADVEATLRRCRMVYDNEPFDEVILSRLLAQVAPHLPPIELSEDEVRWNTLHLNDHSMPFSAFRMTSTKPGMANLNFMIAKSINPKTSWGVLDVEQLSVSQSTPATIKNLKIDGVELPDDDNVLIFETHVLQPELSNQNSIVFFAPKESEPFSIHFASKLLDESETSGGTARSVAHSFGIKLPDLEVPEGFQLLANHFGAIESIVVSENGKTIASTSSDGIIKVWNATTLKEVHSLKNNRHHEHLAISSNGNTLLSGASNEDSLTLWNLSDGTSSEIPVGEEGVNSVNITLDGTHLIASQEVPSFIANYPGSRLLVWSTSKMDSPMTINLPDFNVNDVALSPDGTFLAATGGSMSYRGTIRFYDVKTLELLRETEDENDLPWSHVTFSQDGTQLFMANVGQYLRVMGSRFLNSISSVTLDSSFSDLSMSHDGRVIASTQSDGTSSLWNGSELSFKEAWHPDFKVSCSTVTPDGNQIIYGTLAGNVILRDITHESSPFSVNKDFKPFEDDIGIKFVPIIAGEFTMGSSNEANVPNRSEWLTPMICEQPKHEVRLTRPFYMAAHETTAGQFRQFVEATDYVTSAERENHGVLFYGNNKTTERAGLNWKTPGFQQAGNFPATYISWDDAMAFCKWRTKTEGVKYRLPTEAEWEYACRAGSTGAWYFGDEEGYITLNANTRGKYGYDKFTYTSPVGSQFPNAFGLYDMHGNVFEWCADWYVPDYYPYSETDDPKGPKSGENKVQRGGCYWNASYHVRSSHRDNGPTNQAQSAVGFRVVRETSSLK